MQPLDYSKIIEYENSKSENVVSELEYYFYVLYIELFHVYNMSNHDTKYHQMPALEKLEHFREATGSTVNNKKVKAIYEKLNKRIIKAIYDKVK